MYYKENMPQIAATPPLVEKRLKITKVQADQLAEMEQTLNIPTSALVRMALNAFLPLTGNKGYTAAGIKSAYKNAT
jgi:hypothetical protein